MRTEPGLKLAHSPLVFVLVQVRFPAVLKMAQHIPDIQEALRHKGFTKYVEETMQQLILGPELKTESERRWLFASRSQLEAVLLTNDFVVYQTTRYDVFETFVARFSEILDVIKSQVQIDYAEQVGLRYIDLIRPTETTSASDFLKESLRGFTPDELGVSQIRHQFVIQAKTPQGDLFLKSFENSGKKFLPPDLDATHLKFGSEPSPDEKFRVLDFDHIFRGEVDFNTEDLTEKLWALHELVKTAFLSAVTPDAVEHWKGEGA